MVYVLAVYVMLLIGPRIGMDLETKKWFLRTSFSPLVWGIALAVGLHLMGVMRLDIHSLEWLPAAVVGAVMWAMTKTPVWFTAYPSGDGRRMPPVTVFFIGLVLTDALRGGLERRGLGFRWRLALGLAALVLASCAGDLLYDLMNAVERNTMKSMITWKDPLPFAAMYYGVPLLRVACGLVLVPLVRRNVPAGAAMAALGLAGCALLLLSWYESPLGLTDWFQEGLPNRLVQEHRALSVYAALLLGGTAAMVKRPED